MIGHDFPLMTSFWGTGEPSLAGPLPGDLDVDVAIIGGGFVGLSSAHALKQADPSLRIAVLEAEHVGSGASGRGSGMLVPFLHGIGSVARVFGWEEARWAAGYLLDEAAVLKDFLRAEAIECDYQYSPLIVAAMDDSQAQFLKNRSAELTQCGYEVESLGADELGELIGYPTVAGIAVRERDLAKVQPYALAVGFAHAAIRKGVQLYERTRVLRFDSRPGKVELLTEAGAKVTAKKLVIAAGAQVRKLGWGRFRVFPTAIHSYLLATEPLDAATLARLGSGINTALVMDASPTFCYLRTYQDRLLIGGAGKMFSKADEAADRDVGQYRKVLVELGSRFPFLAEIPLAAAWAGPIQAKPTELPIVRPLAGSPDVVLNIAYVSGVPLSHLAGRLILGPVLGPSYADPQVERLRKIFNEASLSLGELVRFGLSVI